MPSHAGGRWPTAGWGDLIIMRSNILKERSRSLRKNMTIAEKKLWAHLRNKQLENVRFRRQVILGNYIIDFISFDPKIIIEVDGSQHADQVMYDKVRTEYLSSLGYKVMRYWNNEVLNNINLVLDDILNNCFDPPIRPLATFPLRGKAF
jgi:very-short-patch-repair endonuclease